MACLTRIFLASIISLSALPALPADKTYTPEQLRRMVNAGNYPDQGPLNRKETEKMSWVTCLAKTESVLTAIVPVYPVVKLVDSKLMTSTKIWTNDAAMTVTCYSDGRILITSAPYK